MITLKHEENEAKLLMTQEKMRKFERRRDLVGQFIFLAIVVSLIIWASSRFGGTETDSSQLGSQHLCSVSFRWRMPLCHCQQLPKRLNVYLDSIKRLNALPNPEKTPKRTRSYSSL